MSDAALFAAVVNRNSGIALSQCVDNLMEFLSPGQIVVVDCASTDGSADKIEQRGLHLERLSENRGYAGGNNAALRKIKALGGKRALIINPDAVIDGNGIAHLLETISDNPSIGASFPLVRKQGAGRTLEAAFGKINHRHRFVRMVGEKEMGTAARKKYFEVDFGLGCCFIVSVRAFFDAGGFDEEMFAYHDEPDLCIRLRDRGYKTVLVPSAAAVHKGIEQKPMRILAKEYFITRNSWLLMKKHGTFLHWIKFLFFLGLGIGYYLPGAIFGNGRMAYRLKGYWDAILGRPIRKEVVDKI